MSYTVKICPKCKAGHPASIKRCGCGYEWQAASQAKTIHAHDPMHGCCEFEANGDRCHYPGTWNSSTTGSGRWYCRAHSEDPSPEMAITILEQSHRDNPVPDYSITARRKASAKASIGTTFAHSGLSSEAERRANARRMILSIASRKPVMA